MGLGLRDKALEWRGNKKGGRVAEKSKEKKKHRIKEANNKRGGRGHGPPRGQGAKEKPKNTGGGERLI